VIIQKKTLPLKYFHVSPKYYGLQNMFRVFEDGSFTEIEEIFIRIDNVIQHPLRLEINQSENSITVNGQWGLLFNGEDFLEYFLEELYFAMEELNDGRVE